VRAALVRNAAQSRGWSKKHATREVGTFVQNVHTFANHYTRNRPSDPPAERIVVFDEAQRAWNTDHVRKKKKGDRSEPSTMLEIMERCPDWCVIIALVGGGQEIHKGEAGLEEWGQALSQTDKDWQVLVSPQVLVGGAGLAGHQLFPAPPPPNCRVVELLALHLDVSVRSFRAEMLTEWVNFVLRGEADAARAVFEKAKEFPLVLTRDLHMARDWLRDRSRNERRCGLVVSSGSIRHRAYGLEVSSSFRRGYPYDEWFLGKQADVRSSCQLEVAATEFECQGLELDWVGVCWGDDFCIDPASRQWSCRTFRGNKWPDIKNPVSRQYLVNKYRVLLTRAREGIVIWVPQGDLMDSTRDPRPLDETAAFLHGAGIPMLE
jgi:hypothetical protein